MKRQSHILFLFIVLTAFFLDAINVDAMFSSVCMDREDYTGQSTEQAVALASSFHWAQGPMASLSVKFHPKLPKIPRRTIAIVDEDSPSLAATDIDDEELLGLCDRQKASKPETDNPSSLDIYSLCKLLI